MRRRMNVMLAVVLTCSLLLTLQHSMLAQAKSKQKSQGKMQKTKEAEPYTEEQTEREIKAQGDVKSEKTQTSGAERYRAIIQNDLFMPLGPGGEVKREEFILTGILGNSAFIQMGGSDKSFYVVEGQSFGNGAKLVQVGENSVTIFHEGNEKELELASFTLVSRGRGVGGGRSRQRQGNSAKSGREGGTANRSGKERGSGSGKQGGGRGDTDWARKMSMDELRGTRGQIAEYIEGLRAKGVTDPEEYEGAMKKMELVESAMWERGEEKD